MFFSESNKKKIRELNREVIALTHQVENLLSLNDKQRKQYDKAVKEGKRNQEIIKELEKEVTELKFKLKAQAIGNSHHLSKNILKDSEFDCNDLITDSLCDDEQSKIGPLLTFKECPKCVKIKEHTEFFRSTGNVDGLSKWCRACIDKAKADGSHKKCSKCGKHMPIFSFRANTRNPDGLTKSCRRCLDLKSKR